MINSTFGEKGFEHLTMRVVKRNKKTVYFNWETIKKVISRASVGLEHIIDQELICDELMRNIFDGIATSDIEKALVLSTIAFIAKDPAYDVVAKRIFLQRIYKEIMGVSVTDETFLEHYKKAFIAGIKNGMDAGKFDPRFKDYPLEELANHLVIERDDLFKYMGIQTVYERYLFKLGTTLIELPQAFLMRIAMGLSLNEKDVLKSCVDFYTTLSTMRYFSGTPTLLHSGTTHPQLSSCYLTYIDDDLAHIFKCMGDNAQLSKWSGGIGNDWTSLRGTGVRIKSINVEGQGVVPFLKIANDVVAAINRSGSRRGATVAYLEVWHLDYEDFLDLRRNTGDERRRTHDMNTASWIPDLFMKRVIADGEWTLFSPSDVRDLHEISGKKFEEAYVRYEAQARNGEIAYFKTLSARQLWRKMLTRLFETGHPWITFKDPCNVRSPQDHVGVVHSSNLCTEITLNTSREETAVCNLGSIHLGNHIIDGKLDEELLKQTVTTAVHMLDNVIDINYYPTIEAQTSNTRHRPVGLGIMGFQDALFKLDLSFEDPQALECADRWMELISYHAIAASSALAKERGAYQTFKGSKWDRNLFPIDTLDVLEQERGVPIEVNRKSWLDWTSLREHVKQYGMRNSNLMAIAPTATISNITGCFPCIEPIYKNLYVKANMSGEFTVVNEFLVEDLKKLGLWSQDMLDCIKYYDGSVQHIDAIPEHIRKKYKESFELDPKLLIGFTAVRGKWIDQSQSHNVFLQGVSGSALNDVYMTAWKSGLKSTYYLRTLGASQIEKSTLDAKKFGFTQRRVYQKMEAQEVVMQETVQEITEEVMVKSCSITNPDCDSCQ